MLQKTFIVVEVTSLNGKKSYYGKNGKEIPVNDDNFGWYMKEYGFESSTDACKGQRNLEKSFKKHGFNWKSIDFKKCKMMFSDEDAKRFGLKPAF